MAKISAKQIEKPTACCYWTAAPGVNLPAASTLAVTSSFTGKTPSGNATTSGVLTDAPYNRVEIRALADGKAVVDPATGRTIFARLTQASSVWTLTFYTLIGGVETVFNMTGHPQVGAAISYRWCEMVPFENVDPFSAVFAGESVDEVSLNGIRRYYKNTLTITTNGQTSITLPKAPAPDAIDLTELNVNGQEMEYGTDYTISGSTLTWIPAAAGFALSTTDKVGIRVYSA